MTLNTNRLKLLGIHVTTIPWVRIITDQEPQISLHFTQLKIRHFQTIDRNDKFQSFKKTTFEISKFT